MAEHYMGKYWDWKLNSTDEKDKRIIEITKQQ